MDLSATTMAAGRPDETGPQPNRIVFDQPGYSVLHRASAVTRAGLSQAAG
jgi:hypothetical protein